MNPDSSPVTTNHDAPTDAPATPPGTDPRERATPEGDGLNPTRYGDWEKNGRCIDF